MKHYLTIKTKALCESNDRKFAWTGEVTCPNCKALLNHLGTIIRKLMAEKVHFLDTEESIKVLKTCVSPSFLVEIYLGYQSELKAIAEENFENAKDELHKAIQEQFGHDIFIPDYLVREKEFNDETKIAEEKYRDALEYSTNPYAWKQYVNEKFREQLRA